MKFNHYFHKLKNQKSYVLNTTILFFLSLLFVVLFTFVDYGISWDENIQNMYGNAIIKYYLSGFKNDSFLNFPSINHYGGFFDSIVAILNRMHPFGKMEARHLFTALTGILGIVGVYYLTRILAGKTAGLISAIMITLTPTYYGNMFMKPKDIPFAVGYVISVYCILLVINSFPKVPSKLVYWMGGFIGFAIGIRVGGFLLIGYMGLGILIYSLLLLWIKKYTFNFLFQRSSVIVLKSLLISYMVLLLFWPYAQLNPIVNPFHSLFKMSNFYRDVYEIFEGNLIHPSNGGFPRYYLLKYFSINLPELVLILGSFGLLFFVYRMYINFKTQKYKKSISLFIVTLSFGLPLVFFFLKNPPVYNGSRHFVFLVPIFVCMGGIVLYEILHFLYYKSKISFFIFILTMAVYTGNHLRILWQIHPYQYIYYNYFVGGLPGAFKKYEMDYWVVSYAELIKKLVLYVKQNDAEYSPNKRYSVSFCADPLTISYYLPKNFELTIGTKADFLIYSDYQDILASNYKDCKVPKGGKKILTVERFGVPLSYIKDLR